MSVNAACLEGDGSSDAVGFILTNLVLKQQHSQGSRQHIVLSLFNVAVELAFLKNAVHAGVRGTAFRF